MGTVKAPTTHRHHRGVPLTRGMTLAGVREDRPVARLAGRYGVGEDDPAWLNLVRTSAGILRVAVGIGSAAVRAGCRP